LGGGRGEAVDGIFERCTDAVRWRRGLTIAILSVLILILVIFTFIRIIGKVLKHE
jgi:hypothetical protein